MGKYSDWLTTNHGIAKNFQIHERKLSYFVI